MQEDYCTLSVDIQLNGSNSGRATVIDEQLGNGGSLRLDWTHINPMAASDNKIQGE